MSVDRFDCVLDGDFEPFASMEKSSDGAYVRYEDHEEVVKDLKDVLELSWYITRVYAKDDFNDDRTRSLDKLKELIGRYEV
jgi:hypothetical protein